MYKKISPEGRLLDLGFTEIWKFRELLISFSIRDIKLRYKQTALGIFWVILQPLLTSIIFSVIFGKLANLPSGDMPYELFAFAGLLPWNLVSQAVRRSGQSVVKEKNLIGKVYFPRIIIPLSSAASAFVDFLISLAASILLVLLYGYPISLKLLFLPIPVLLCIFTALGIGFMVSALSVYYRDFSYALPFVLQTWLYISPTAYSTELITGPLSTIYAINPMVGIIESFRWMLLEGQGFPGSSLILSLIISPVFLIVGIFFFRRLEDRFVDVI